MKFVVFSSSGFTLWAKQTQITLATRGPQTGACPLAAGVWRDCGGGDERHALSPVDSRVYVCDTDSPNRRRELPLS